MVIILKIQVICRSRIRQIPATALIPMKATQLKVYRTWNSMIDGLKMKGKTGNVYTPAPYSHIYRLKTVQMSNDKGSWYGWSVSRVGPVEDAAFIIQLRILGTI